MPLPEVFSLMIMFQLGNRDSVYIYIYIYIYICIQGLRAYSRPLLGGTIALNLGA